MAKEILELIKRQNTEIQQYKDPRRLEEAAVPFLGHVQRPKNGAEDRIFLNITPLSGHNLVMEFKLKDVVFAEEMQAITQNDGETTTLMKLWVKKGSVGLKLEPFLVQNYPNNFGDLD